MYVGRCHSNRPLRREPNANKQRCTQQDPQTGRTCTNLVSCHGDASCESCSDKVPCCVICGRRPGSL